MYDDIDTVTDISEKDEFNKTLNSILAKADAAEELVEEEVDEVEEELDTEDDAVQQEETEELAEEVVPVQKTTSKEQAAIIALKRELKDLREAQKQALAKEAEAEADKEKSELVKQYINEGYDKDTAERNAVQDLKISQVEKRLAVSDFKAENAILFEKYPRAKLEAETVMRNAKLTGMSIEAICLGMYSDTIDVTQERAKAAVTGQLKAKTVDSSVSSATRTAGTAKTTVLTQADRQKKAEFESKFGVVTEKRYLELKEKYQF